MNEKIIIDLCDNKQVIEESLKKIITNKGFEYKKQNGCFIVLGELFKNYGKEFEFINGNIQIVNSNIRFYDTKKEEYVSNLEDHWFLYNSDYDEYYDISLEQFGKEGIKDIEFSNKDLLNIDLQICIPEYFTDEEEGEYVERYSILDFQNLYKNCGMKKEIVESYKIV